MGAVEMYIGTYYLVVVASDRSNLGWPHCSEM